MGTIWPPLSTATTSKERSPKSRPKPSLDTRILPSTMVMTSVLLPVLPPLKPNSPVFHTRKRLSRTPKSSTSQILLETGLPLLIQTKRNEAFLHHKVDPYIE